MQIRYEKTGEIRPPSVGEWFQDSRGFPVRAMFTFKVTSHPILREIREEVKVEHVACGVPQTTDGRRVE